MVDDYPVRWYDGAEARPMGRQVRAHGGIKQAGGGGKSWLGLDIFFMARTLFLVRLADENL